MFLCCTTQLKVEGHHVNGYKYPVNKKLTCAVDHNNNDNSNAIKVLFRNDEKKKEQT